MAFDPGFPNASEDAHLIEQKPGTSSTVDDGGGSLSVDDDGGSLTVDDGGGSLTVDDGGVSLKVDIHDGAGNPISSVLDPATGEYILNTHAEDIHHRAVNRYLHQHTATMTTIFSDAAVNDYAINVADTTGFIVGNSIDINTGTIEVTHPVITAITPGTPGVLTLDRRLDKAHSVGDEVTNVIIDLASQVGSLATPQIYWAGPEAGEIWHITTLTLAMGHTTAGDLGLFGNQAAFTNGVVLRIKSNGNYGTLTNWKSNGDIDVDTGNVTFPPRSGGGGTYGTSSEGPFKFRTGAVMRLVGDDGDRFELYIQDDPTGLNFWNMKLQGHFSDL